MDATAIHQGLRETWLGARRSKALPGGELTPNTLLCLRAELRFTPYREASGQERWVVHDPVTRSTYRMGAAEYRILQFCKTERSVSDVVRETRRSSGERNAQLASLGEAEVLRVLQRLRAFRLVRTIGPREPVEPNRWAWTRLLSSVVVWRMPGINVDPVLARVARVTDVVFSATAVRFWLVLFSIVAVATLANMYRLFAELPLGEKLTTQAAGVWVVIFILTRAAHELGHAVVCRRFGIRCPDIGFLFIVGTPCLYCDVSESWQLVERWKRASVAAAGMYVELIIATLALGFWLVTDGVTSQLALQVACVCSVSTVLINGNPLMKFDGYHILADWCDEANLRGKADQEAFHCVSDLVLGATSATRSEKHQLGSQSSQSKALKRVARVSAKRERLYRSFLVSFSIASWGYRAMLSLAICGALVAVYSRWNLPWVGRGIAAMVLFGMWGTSLWQFMLTLRAEAKSRLRKSRWWIFCWLVALVVMFVPIPQRQSGRGWVQPSESQGIYASSNARLIECKISDQTVVSEREQVFVLRAEELALKVLEKGEAMQIAQQQHEQLDWNLKAHSEDIDLEPAKKIWDARTQEYDNALEALGALIVLAPTRGVFLGAEAPPARIPKLPSEERLPDRTDFPPKWSSSDQVGRVVPAGTLLGNVVGRKRFVVIPLSREKLERIAAGTPVKLLLSASNQQVVESYVEKVLPFSERSHSGHANINPKPTQELAISSNSNHQFAAEVPLPDHLSPVVGSGVEVVFHLPSKTAFGVLRTWAYGNLRFLSD